MSDGGITLVDPRKIFGEIGLNAGMRVADLGCGRTGHFVFLAARAVGETGVVYAVDILKDVLENIKSRVRSEGYENIRPVWSDLEKLGGTPVPEKSLDACFMVNVMFQFKDRAAAVKEAGRLLKDGGFLVVVDWAKKLGPLGPAPELMVTPEAAAAAATPAGLKEVKNLPAGDYHFCSIFKKI